MSWGMLKRSYLNYKRKRCFWRIGRNDWISCKITFDKRVGFNHDVIHACSKVKTVQEKILNFEEKTNNLERDLRYTAKLERSPNDFIGTNSPTTSEDINNLDGMNVLSSNIEDAVSTSNVSDGDSDDSQNLDMLEDDIEDDAWSYTSGGSDLSNISRSSLPANIYQHMSTNKNNTQRSTSVRGLNNKHRAYHHHTFDDVVFSTQFRTRSASFNFQQSSSGQSTPRTYRKRILKELASTDNPFDLSECTLTGHTKSVTSIHLIGSRFVISGSADCTVMVWDLHTRRNLQTLMGHTGWVRSVTSDISDVADADEYERLIDDLKFVVSGSGDGTIRLWDISNPDLEEKCIKILKGHEGGVTCVKSDSNGVIVSSSVDKTVKIWDRNQSECVQTLIGHEKYVKTLQFRSHALVTGGGDRCIRLWDIRSGKCHRKINTHDPVNVLQFNEDQIVAGCHSGQILDFDLKAGKLRDSLASHGGPISGLKFLGSRLIFSSTVPITSAYHKQQSIDINGYSPRNTPNYKVNGRTFLCLNPIEYNLETKKTTREFFGHFGSVNSLDFSTTKLVTGSTDHTIKAWNLT